MSGRYETRIAGHHPLATAALASDTALGQWLAVEIVLATVDRRAGEPSNPCHGLETAPTGCTHFRGCEHTLSPLIELRADCFTMFIDPGATDGPSVFVAIRDHLYISLLSASRHRQP